MKLKAVLIILSVAALSIACDLKHASSPGNREVLISKGFIGDNSYRIVCRGYAAEGVVGIQRTEASKRAALLGAYHVARSVFTDAVAPDRDGRTEKIEYREDHVILHYVISKKGLKNMVRTRAGD
ncbi:MAG: hypothetical protein JW807_04405 [Spirochaetes bacterium]|nr:hypothetical protein [Spirochaetota bacterium]